MRNLKWVGAVALMGIATACTDDGTYGNRSGYGYTPYSSGYNQPARSSGYYQPAPSSGYYQPAPSSGYYQPAQPPRYTAYYR